MRVKCLCLVFLLVVIQPSWAQEYNSQVKEIIDQVNVDSLVSFVRILSGEDSLHGGKCTSTDPTPNKQSRIRQ